MCESFNNAILEYRDKPIITLLEGLKHYITTRIVKQKNLMSRFRGSICPKVEQTIERLKRESGGWAPTWHGDDALNIFSVSNGQDTFEVNLQKFHCACSKWAFHVCMLLLVFYTTRLTHSLLCLNIIGNLCNS